jgi:hypothetical protein
MPSTIRSICLNAIAIAAAIALTQGANAADDIVKPAATPMPTAGPTVAAAVEFCGEPTGTADELFTRYSTGKGLKEVYKSPDYVAFSDDPKNSTAMYTFTVKGHAAHPAAVCRKLMKEGDQAIIKMVVVCNGEADACTKLQNDFNVLTAQMQLDVDNQIKDAAKK